MILRYKEIEEGLNVIKEIKLSYLTGTLEKPNYGGQSGIVEIPLVPGIGGGVDTVIQQAGKPRLRSQFTGVVKTYEEYLEVCGLMLGGYKIELECKGVFKFLCCIEEIGESNSISREVFDIKFIEEEGVF